MQFTSATKVVGRRIVFRPARSTRSVAPRADIAEKSNQLVFFLNCWWHTRCTLNARRGSRSHKTKRGRGHDTSYLHRSANGTDFQALLRSPPSSNNPETQTFPWLPLATFASCFLLLYLQNITIEFWQLFISLFLFMKSYDSSLGCPTYSARATPRSAPGSTTSASSTTTTSATPSKYPSTTRPSRRASSTSRTFQRRWRRSWRPAPRSTTRLTTWRSKRTSTTSGSYTTGPPSWASGESGPSLRPGTSNRSDFLLSQGGKRVKSDHNSVLVECIVSTSV